jgi:sulfate adenylyltransferase subunit 1
VKTQTRRHSFIVSLLGIKHVIVAVNKMDIAGFSEDVFNRIRDDYRAFASDLDIPDIRFVPISALRGDNVVNASGNMPWYGGPTLMQLLETVEVTQDVALDAFRLPVQYVNRPNLDFRGFCGSIAAGQVSRGDAVTVLPSGRQSRVRQVLTPQGDAECAFVGQAVTLTLEDEIDISRGDMIVRSGEAAPFVSQAFDAHVVWMNDNPLSVGKEYIIKLAGKAVFGRIERVLHRIDVNSLAQAEAAQLGLNEIGLCRVVLNAPVAFDAYRACRGSGSFIVIDRLSNATAGAGMISASAGADAAALRARHEELLAAIPEQELREFVRRHYPHWGVKAREEGGGS